MGWFGGVARIPFLLRLLGGRLTIGRTGARANRYSAKSNCQVGLSPIGVFAMSSCCIFRRAAPVSMTVTRFVTAATLVIGLSRMSWAAAPIKLNGPLGPGQNVTAGRVQISPDGSRVLYLGDQDADNVFEIFSVPIGGGTRVQLSGTLATGGDVLVNGLDISPDGSRVLYYADQTTDEVFEAFSVPLSGGTATKLNGTLAVGGDVSNAGLRFNSSSS
jgi:hypothetical protein